MKNKKILIVIIMIIIIILIAVTFFYKSMFKNLKVGNNMSSQEIVDNILNISSYKTQITVTVNSNKNTNKYVLKQEYIAEGKCTQEVLEPSNIAGLKIVKENDNITIENTALSLNTIHENYSGLEENALDLSSFISDYKNSNKFESIEEENQIILKTEAHNENKYRKYKTLYIDKETHNPTKLTVEDNNKNITINILYNEVELNK